MATNTVDQIRMHLSQNSGVNEQTMLPLAREYAEDVQRANVRLQACTNLLHRGLRSEAIQQANIRPNLIDLCAKLDFPEFEEWLEILQFLGITLPDSLNRDAVQQLQEALVDEQPLEDLLRQHRRLAIGKAPLAWRLKVLRNIAKLDTNNLVWVEDVEVWERARLKEIKVQLDAASASRDLASCSTIDKELKSPKWLLQPPKELIKQASELRLRFEYDHHIAELQRIAHQLNDAFCETDKAKALQLRSSWQAIVAELKRPIPKSLQDVAEPALLWLTELDREAEEQAAYLRAIAHLERTLESSRLLPDIERAYHLATRGGLALDPMIERRYQSLKSELQLAGRRRQWVIVSAVLATCAVMVIALFLWQSERSRANDLSVACETLRRMLNESRLEDAQAFINQIESSKRHVAGNAEFTSLVSELQGKSTEEKERAQAFATYLAEADHEDPARIDRSAINRAEKLARTDADKSEIFRIRTRREQWEQEAERKDFQALRQDLEPIKRAIEDVQKTAIDSLDENDLRDILKGLETLKSRYVYAGAGGRELIDTYHSKVSSLLNSHQSLVDGKRREADSVDRIRNAKSLGELRKALETSIAEIPNGRYASDFKKANADSSRWLLADRWNDISVDAEKFLAKFDPSAASSLLKKMDEQKGRLHGYLLTRIPESTERSLKLAMNREAELDKLISDLENSHFSDLVSIEAPVRKGDKPQRFFASAEHVKRQEATIARMKDETARSSKFEVAADAEGTVESRTLYPPLTVKAQPKRFLSELVDYLKTNRARVLNAWDAELIQQMGKTLQAAELDPGHRTILVGRMLQTAIEGSSFQEQRLKDSMKYLEHQLTEPADWFHPKTASARYDLPDELRRMVYEPLSSTYLKRDESNSDLRTLSQLRLNWIGTLLKNGNQASLHLRSSAGEGDLVVLVHTDAEEPLQSVLIGQLEKGQATLKQGDPAIISGRPVFLLSRPK